MQGRQTCHPGKGNESQQVGRLELRNTKPLATVGNPSLAYLHILYQLGVSVIPLRPWWLLLLVNWLRDPAFVSIFYTAFKSTRQTSSETLLEPPDYREHRGWFFTDPPQPETARVRLLYPALPIRFSSKEKFLWPRSVSIQMCRLISATPKTASLKWENTWF